MENKPQKYASNQRKIINDPVYGFINFPSDLFYKIIEHPYFQRLRRIKQLGLSELVYPGAVHSRFQHVLGASHLMKLAIEVLRNKGNQITEKEAEGVLLAILLHDIGHAPFSHTLERCFIEQMSHEELSLHFMEELNEIFDNQLLTAIQIFKNEYPKKFLHQLVSSQLDMDRLDYLRRDSFYTGVLEGVVGVDRIIKMLDIVDDEIVVEEKGIYSIEKFLISRRLMYWQVYLHKTVVCAEQMLLKIIQRAKYLVNQGVNLYCSPSFAYFLNRKGDLNNLHQDVEMYSQLDDYDVLAAIKVWANHDDKVLSTLCNGVIHRNLFKIEISNQPFEIERVEELKQVCRQKMNLTEVDVEFFVFSDSITNNAYSVDNDNIKILTRNGSLVDIAEASDISNVRALSKTVEKYILCYPREVFL